MAKNKEKKKAGELYQYDAFISYRHQDPDKAVAEELHKQLESFKMPKNVDVMLNNGHTKIERVFRDEEELPIASDLENSIVTALENSEWLIVICSPRLIESEWCRLEIKTFIELHGRDHVLAVLVEGEPETAFPPELVYENTTVTDEYGVTRTEQKYIEPLAADIRGENKKEILKNIAGQKLRLIAAMFHLNYDDLKQRHRERKIRRRLAVLAGVAIAATIIGAFSLVMLLRISSQKKQIELQNAEILAQAAEIEAKNQSLLVTQAKNQATIAQNYLADNDRFSALNTAYKALTKIDENDMPYTASAEYALTSALYVYAQDGYAAAYDKYDVPSEISYMTLSTEGSYLAVLDSSNWLTVWDTKSMQIIKSVGNIRSTTDLKKSIGFLSDDTLIYIAYEDELGFTDNYGTTYKLTCTDGNVTKLECPLSFDQYDVLTDDVCLSAARTYDYYVVLNENGGIAVYDKATSDVIGTIVPGDETVTTVYADAASAPTSTDEEDTAADSDTAEADVEATDTEDIETTDDTTNIEVGDESISVENTLWDVTNCFANDEYIITSVIELYSQTYYLRVYDSTTMEIVKNYCTDDLEVSKAYIEDGILYYECNNFNDLMNLKSEIHAIDLSTDVQVWNTTCNELAAAFYHTTISDQTYILVLSNYSLFIFDQTTGELIDSFSNGNKIVNLYAYTSAIRILTSDNVSYFMSRNDDGSFTDAFGTYLTAGDSVFSNIEINFQSGGEIYGAISGTNTFVMYGEVNCPDLSPLTSSTNAVGVGDYAVGSNYMDAAPSEKYYYNQDYASGDQEQLQEFADTYGFENTGTVDSIVAANDGSLIIVNRSNHTFEIYTEDRTNLGVFTLDSGMMAGAYLGTDDNGNYYITDSNAWYGLKISPEGEVLASIYGLCGLDAKNNEIVRVIEGECMTQPIYSTDELLAMAEELLGL